MSTVKSEPRKQGGCKPGPAWNRRVSFIFKCRPSWLVLLDEFAARRHVTASALVGVALAALAEADGFRPPPER